MANTTRHRVHFSGQTIDTTVTKEASIVDSWVNGIQTPLVVGLDCEWRPNYIRGITNKVALLQLCANNKCLILQISHMAHIPQSLENFLNDHRIKFVGVGIEQDVFKLLNDYGLAVSNAVDIGPLGKEYIDRNFIMVTKPRLGLKDFAWHVVNLRMEKPRYISLSNWEAWDLSLSQIEYACIDAYVSYRIGYKLLIE